MTIQQFHKYPCAFCKKKEATQFCDFVVGYRGQTIFSGKDGYVSPPSTETCDNQVCKDCMTDYEGHEFCPDCVKLNAYIVLNHVKRKGMMMTDIIFGRLEVKS